MPKTPTGQQYSDATPYKLDAFRYLMSFHAGVCELILRKYHQKYIYIDLNCGAGYQPEYQEFGEQVYGSPIIAIQELNEKNICPVCHFIDISQDSLASLEHTIQQLNLKCKAHYWNGNNKDCLIKISKIITGQNFQGLLYSDPNGKQDFPLKEIKNFLGLPQMRKVDLLLNVATTYVKRWEVNPKVNWEAYSLKELINGHGKKRVFIRNPENSALKWSFIYATNWDKQKNIPKIRLYDIDGDVGKRIVDHLFSPSNNPLPFGADGSIHIQGNLFDS